MHRWSGSFEIFELILLNEDIEDLRHIAEGKRPLSHQCRRYTIGNIIVEHVRNILRFAAEDKNSEKSVV
jgi:hypothetical protein